MIRKGFAQLLVLLDGIEPPEENLPAHRHLLKTLFPMSSAQPQCGPSERIGRCWGRTARTSRPGRCFRSYLQSLLRRGALDRVAVLAIETYGTELFAFLIKASRSESDAREIFSQLVEDLWRGLPTFGSRCSFRSWLYTLARHAHARFRRSPWNQAARRLREEDISEIAAVTRTITQAWRRTGIKDSWRSLRESLAPDDRALLVLRVDRRLEWNAIALITLSHESPDGDTLIRESNRLKKRFQILKADLRRRAQEAGLLEEKP